MSSTVTSHLSKNVVKDGTIMPISEALAPNKLTDEKGNTISFTDLLPKYYVESNGFAYSLEGLDKALITLRIEKLPERQEQKDQSLQRQEQQQQQKQVKSKPGSK